VAHGLARSWRNFAAVHLEMGNPRIALRASLRSLQLRWSDVGTWKLMLRGWPAVHLDTGPPREALLLRRPEGELRRRPEPLALAASGPRAARRRRERAAGWHRHAAQPPAALRPGEARSGQRGGLWSPVGPGRANPFPRRTRPV
jgi:hypothetical protein